MHLLEPREHPSQLMKWLSPVIALAAMLVVGSILFLMLGISPAQAMYVFFIEPLMTSYGWSELAVKAGPLILIALGLAVGFRAKLFNIGAEGQLIMGAIFGGGIALLFHEQAGWWILPLMIFMGAIGGALWGAIPALLKTHFNAEETLTTLMMNYVALFVLLYLVNGPWRDSEGMNFPQTVMFSESATLPMILEGTRVNASIFIIAVAVLLFWLFMRKSMTAFKLEVSGQAPLAAKYAGFSSSKAIWLSLVISGMMAGIAGICEVAGPIGQLNPSLSPGYGYAAIIVAYLGRLNPIGIVLSGSLMALIYLGGEMAQMQLQLPVAITGIFQGLLLFFLLGSDALIENRYRFAKKRVVPAAEPASANA
ncbi:MULTISPECIES: ABC transporter permease [Acinetobacter]|jgi:simple sugar transport system permease protein|uniref:ABC transporter permease n=1 Tax=Acinetobacter schindleri TaxID=108981 RepID=A0AAE6WUE8_9GAMM|nr:MULTISPECIES: ABC transporter permease [Acinetobacter]MCU4519097.1 ABC transporter permease [Acinetobacter schindleri]OIJ38492.1 sugar ABC transporter permease [Acinetobacter sp. LCT-H3]QIC67250.1 ABC transporter permease [Acinetobacter schindleri]UOH76285.1 ABC transporter permease [Acinetobacter schindleri]WDE14763.1 ABC transporter permease [Acinetobacter schindleri]